MRLLIQIVVMLGDLLIIAACAAVWVYSPGVIALILTILTFRAWRETGGWIAWTPAGIKAWFRNAKEMGLP